MTKPTLFDKMRANRRKRQDIKPEPPRTWLGPFEAARALQDRIRARDLS